MYILCLVQFDDEPHSRIVREGCDVQEVNVGEEEKLEDAIATATDSNGKYPNNACQEWNIITSPSKVKFLLFCLNNSDMLQCLSSVFYVTV